MVRAIALVFSMAILVALLDQSVFARTWIITADGTGDAPSIQAGLDSALAGDTVLVECGTYNEHDIRMKAGVYLKGEPNPLSCVIIDARKLGKGLICDSNHKATVIEGLTLVNCLVPALQCSGSSPSVLNCIFAYNESPAVVIDFWAPSFSHCIFYGNFSPNQWPSPTIIVAYAGGMATISNCTFLNNSAGVSLTTDGTAIVENSIFADCTDGFSLGSDDSSWFTSITCCTFWNNAYAADDSFTVSANPGCFIADPRFCGSSGSVNYYLQSDSPCAPGNHPNGYDCGLIGALPVNCTKVETKNRSWGFIKALYDDKARH